MQILIPQQLYPQVFWPEDLNGTPQVENEEHHGTVLHFPQASKDDKQYDIPAHHLLKQSSKSQSMKKLLV